MTSNNDLNSLLSQLKEFENSQDYSNIINTLNHNFDLKTNDIIKKWISNDTLSTNEKNYIDLYSNVQLSFVKYCFFNSNTIADVQTMIGKFPGRLFQKSQTDTLAAAVEFIREQQSNSVNEDDLILVYIMRMIDARSLAYRLCFTNLSPPPRKLNDELKECLLDRQAKSYLYNVKSTDETDENMSIDYRHKFFIGCCTFAVALREDNKDILIADERNNKYICLLVKYVRIMLSKTNFAKNDSTLYCIRGILALLTNCIPLEYWLNIMNEALANENDENAQRKNPFNLDLFSLIVNKLLASTTLQKKTEGSGSNDETLLLDTVLVFLVKWSDTQRDLNDDDEEDTNNNNNSSPFDKPNQLLRCFSSHEQFKRTALIIIPYIDAKYDRLRLMALSILSNIMDEQDFKQLESQKPHMAKDLIKLIFDFIDQAEKQPNHKYKGISFDMLLRYLLRFLVQDFVKKETVPYISKIVDYAQNYHLYALKILRKISTNPKLKDDLLKNVDLKQFLETEANIKYGVNEKMNKIVKDIRQNLAPSPPKPTETLPPDNGNHCQAFLSYCHDNTVMCKSIQEKLRKANLFTNIWVDKHYMRDNMVETVSKAISQSKVVFVLLSDAYCQSDFCRREWTYALEEKIKVYVLVVQNDFNRRKYDWVRFCIGGERYYKIHDDDEFQNLIEHLSETLNKKFEHESNGEQSDNETRPSIPNVPADNCDYLRKPSIATWTSEDIQNWCTDKHLHKWRKPLTYYDGQNLIQLRRDLSNDSHIQYIVKENTLNGFDVARFKSEIDKLLPITTKYKPPTIKHVQKRRISKSSNK